MIRIIILCIRINQLRFVPIKMAMSLLIVTSPEWGAILSDWLAKGRKSGGTSLKFLEGVGAAWEAGEPEVENGLQVPPTPLSAVFFLPSFPWGLGSFMSSQDQRVVIRTEKSEIDVTQVWVFGVPGRFSILDSSYVIGDGEWQSLIETN